MIGKYDANFIIETNGLENIFNTKQSAPET